MTTQNGKMYCKTIEIGGFAPAFKGMRNPKNSWDKSDSRHLTGSLEGEDDYYADYEYKYILGEKDLKLAQTLISAGTEHCKFLRMIQVWVDINLPRYVWSEFDTYHYNTKNSCSTMHKLFVKGNVITLDDFYYETVFEEISIANTIVDLNALQKEYFRESNQLEKNKLLASAKRILNEGFLQLRTVNTNYAEIRNIYKQRLHHRLKSEWQDTFCVWVQSLPYFEELINI